MLTNIYLRHFIAIERLANLQFAKLQSLIVIMKHPCSIFLVQVLLDRQKVRLSVSILLLCVKKCLYLTLKTYCNINFVLGSDCYGVVMVLLWEGL